MNEKINEALLHGEIHLQGQFLPGSNYTFLVTVSHAGREFPAVYKPQRGEQTLWDFPQASLAGREVAACQVSEALDFGFVPLTVLRDGPFGPGSLQQFIDHDPSLHYFNFDPTRKASLRPVALFDLLINNADRKGSHLLVEKRTRRLFLIDHGLCFHAEDKLRTVIWGFAGERFAPEYISVLGKFEALLSKDLSSTLQTYLTGEELAALKARIENLLANPVFPFPPEDRRAFPFPPL